MENNIGNRTDIGGTTTGDSASTGGATATGGGSQNLIDRAEQQARSRLNATKKDAALTLSSVASTLLSSSSQLKDEQQNLAGEYVGKAAEQIDRLATYIQNADPSEVADNIERFARRRPAVFIGAAFALGVIGARFLKSSRRRSYDGDRLYSPGIADREVPTLRSVEGGVGTTSSPDLTSRGVYGDGGFSASAGMPSSVPASGTPGATTRGDPTSGGRGSGELP
jgi:hypothetical protein